MTVKEMLVESLQAKGFDGLCNDEGCCCSIEDYGLALSCGDFDVMNCEPGHQSRCCDKECDCQGFHISANPPKKRGGCDA